MARSGPPLRIDAASITALGAERSEPIVCDIDRAAQLLGQPAARLQDAVRAAGLSAWGAHSSGAAVYRWPELCEAAAAAGIPVPATRPTLREHQAKKAVRRQRNPGQRKRKP